MSHARLPAAILAALLVAGCSPATDASGTAPDVAEDADASDAAQAPARGRTMQEVLDASQPGDWRELDPENTLYLELESGRVVIELAPAFAPAHVANIRTLARGQCWEDRTSAGEG